MEWTCGKHEVRTHCQVNGVCTGISTDQAGRVLVSLFRSCPIMLFPWGAMRSIDFSKFVVSEDQLVSAILSPDVGRIYISTESDGIWSAEMSPAGELGPAQCLMPAQDAMLLPHDWPFNLMHASGKRQCMGQHSHACKQYMCKGKRAQPCHVDAARMAPTWLYCPTAMPSNTLCLLQALDTWPLLAGSHLYFWHNRTTLMRVTVASGAVEVAAQIPFQVDSDEHPSWALHAPRQGSGTLYFKRSCKESTMDVFQLGAASGSTASSTAVQAVQSKVLMLGSGMVLMGCTGRCAARQ